MNFTFLRDMFTENKGGKFSSKKFWGHIFMLLIGVSYACDGLDWYEINNHLFDSMLIAGTTLIGLNSIRSFFTKKDTPDETK